MCGIFAAIDTKKDKRTLFPYYEKIQHRGPDDSNYKEITERIHFGFHRLAINGLNPESNQPFCIDGIWLIANAEIFNYKELASQHNIDLISGSDCEILIHLYRMIGLEKMLDLLVGEYAFVLYDSHKDVTYACRDHLGIRGMYMGTDKEGATYFASEAKALTFCDALQQFPPRHIWTSKTKTFAPYYKLEFAFHSDQSEDSHLKNINALLTKSVELRMLSDRKIGCLLSGGLDSSLVSAIVARKAENPKDIETFSIGMEGSPDLIAAQKVADHIGTTHHSIVYAEHQFIQALKETIYITGSFDVTTIRASVGHQLVSNWIKEHSDVKVVFTGETIDEMGSYLYFQQAPSPKEFQSEAVRLLEDIHYFDMLRGDRSISSAGLEARVPFADREFVEYFMGIDPALRMFDGKEKIEKYLLRKAFEHEELLPKDILWRRKNGFSDSVSKKTRSWSTLIQEHVHTLVSNKEFEQAKDRYSHDSPLIKEAYWYRKVFEEYYGKFDKATPYQWLPKWCGEVTDPSARVLQMYKAD